MLALTEDDLHALKQPGVFQEMLISAGDYRLIGEVCDAADLLEVPSHRFAALAVQRFLERADDDAWTDLLSRMRDSNAPMPAAISFILRKAVADVEEAWP